MTEAAFRRIALGMQGAVEGAHMAHPDFRIGGRIFATLRGDGLHGMVTLPLEHQERFVRDFPGVFVPESGAWGRAGSTRIVLKKAKEDTVGEAITLAWQHAVAKGPTKARAAKTKKSWRS